MQGAGPERLRKRSMGNDEDLVHRQKMDMLQTS
jgi:hypothetical protein